jgi:hypothetical protein
VQQEQQEAQRMRWAASAANASAQEITKEITKAM